MIAALIATTIVVGTHEPSRYICQPGGAGQPIVCAEPPRWICTASGAGRMPVCWEYRPDETTTAATEE